MKPTLQLTYIPADYWTESVAKFQILGAIPKLPKDTGFFIFWIPQENNILSLEDQTAKYFPQIPVSKLLSCNIQLAVPFKISEDNANKNRKVSTNYWKIDTILGKIVPLPPAIKLLFQLQIIDSKDRTQKIKNYPDSIKTWAYLTKLTMELLNRGNFVPFLEEMDEKSFEGKWKIILKTQFDHTRFNKILRNGPFAAYNLPIDFIRYENETYITHGIWHPSFLFAKYMDNLGDFMIRNTLSKGFFKKFTEIYGYKINLLDNSCDIDGKTPWDLRFLNACMSKNRIFEIYRFCDSPVPSVLRNWVQNAQGFSFSLGVSFTFRLEYPKTSKSDWVLGYYIQPLQKPDYYIPLKEIWSGAITQKNEFANACEDENILQEEILRALGTAKNFFPPIRRSLEGKNPQRVKLKADEVMDFLRYSRHLLIQAGFNVVLPEQFDQKGQQRLSARMVLRKKQNSTMESNQLEFGSKSSIPIFDMNSMLEYEWEAQLEGKKLTEEEFLELSNSNEPLIYWRGQWILIDQQDMESLRPIFEKHEKNGAQMTLKGKISYSEALKIGMIGGIQLQEDGNEYEVCVEGDFANVIGELRRYESFEPIKIPPTFNGKLRPYQKEALTWLVHMSALNFGVCLADDMGLGKTIEIISFLLYLKENKKNQFGSILIVCPTSLLFNWVREIQKFAPSFDDVIINHGPTRFKDINAINEFTIPYRLIITTYGTIRNDIDFLETIPFSGIIIDESQNIKNYKTKQTQAVYRLQGNFRIALSGTPIENRLLELWTLFQFLNPGLFGRRTDFQKKFILPIERFRDERVAQKLKQFINPFLMRRVKSDKNIIKDLPEKNEIKIYLELSDEQKQLYNQVVNQTLKELENTKNNTKKRRGLVLRLLTHTKQICNHPYQYLHLGISHIDFQKNTNKFEDEIDDSELSEEELQKIKKIDQISVNDFIQSSTKMERLIEMIDEILEDGEKILIFTQFRQMGELLQKILTNKYHFPVLFFHGGVSAQKRNEIVDDFQSSDLDSSPIMILSLKAGGTGLNLTQASTVFHFDRWWNPAVEDQATDRAYRIGQKSRVNVFKFISHGTIEDKIDMMLEEKRNLADKIISSTSQQWITTLSDNELKELFSLSNPNTGGI